MVDIRRDMRHRSRGEHNKRMRRKNRTELTEQQQFDTMSDTLKQLQEQGIDIFNPTPPIPLLDRIPVISTIRAWVRNRREGVPQVPVGVPVDSRVAQSRTQQRHWYTGLGEALIRLRQRLFG